MEKPVLVIMAAGMGSRYGGLKQIDPVDKAGHIIMDFSVYDAKQAGFEKVIFVIKRENEQLFKEAIGNRVSETMEVEYVFQDITALPEGYAVPEGRVKPWGTGHAVLCCLDKVNGPFAVINADDYYGRNAFKLIYDYLVQAEDDEKYHYAMISYILKNTLTENGSVARGVCSVSEEGYLTDIVERTKIIETENGAAFTEDDGATWQELDPESEVSMNFWGFSKSLLDELKAAFPVFLDKNLPVNPEKCEFFLPFAVDDLLKEGKADVKVINTPDKWFGVTYHEDKAMVQEKIAAFEESGYYPTEF